jgi:hypothetical protein
MSNTKIIDRRAENVKHISHVDEKNCNVFEPFDSSFSFCVRRYHREPSVPLPSGGWHARTLVDEDALFDNLKSAICYGRELSKPLALLDCDILPCEIVILIRNKRGETQESNICLW